MTTIVRTAEVRELGALYVDLLEPSFLVDELESLEGLSSDVVSGRVVVHVAVREGEPVAIAVIRSLTPEVSLLAYFAARADQRGSGVGGMLYDTVLEGLRGDQTIGLVLAEVEHPDHHPVDDAHGDPVARLRFYGRRGARLLDVPYVQPALGDGAPVYALMLLALHVRPDLESSTETLTGIGPLRRALAGHNELLAAIDAPGGVPLLDVSEVSRVQVSCPPA